MRFQAHPYQQYCIQRAITDERLILLLDMGLGKTVITLTAVNDLKYNRFQASRVLVIAPKKVAEDTWVREADKWDHLRRLRILPVLGSRLQRIRALNSPGDVWVLSRDNVQWLVDYYRNDWPFDMVVIDELSSFKNHQAKRFKAIKAILPHIRRLIGLTGTPAPNGLIDLWAQMYLFDQGARLGKTIGQYRECYFSPDKRSRTQIFTYALTDGAEQQIKAKIADICISLQAKDYLQLPERISNTVYVRLDVKAQKDYNRMQSEMLLEVDEEMIDAGSAAVLSNKLLQLCNGAIYDEVKQAHEIHTCKLEAFLELLDAAQGKPVLVFYNFKHDRDRIQTALARSGRVVRDLKDPQTIDDWNHKKIEVLLAHPASAAYGLNLQAGGSIIIWFGLTWSLELYQQANARLYRQGQTEAVIIHHLVVAGGMDEDVMDALEQKRETQDALLDALKARIKHVKEEQDERR